MNQLSLFGNNGRYRSYIEYISLRKEYLDKIYHALKKYENKARQELAEYALSQAEVEDILTSAFIATLRQALKKSQKLMQSKVNIRNIFISEKYYRLNVKNALSQLKAKKDRFINHVQEDFRRDNVYTLALEKLRTINEELYNKITELLKNLDGKKDIDEIPVFSDKEKADLALALELARMEKNTAFDYFEHIDVFTIYESYNNREYKPQEYQPHWGEYEEYDRSDS